MNNGYTTEQPKDRLVTVLEMLKKQGISQKTISEELDRTEDYLSNLKSGKIKNIPDEVLTILQEKFNVNPAYIRLESDYAFMDIGKSFDHFGKFVSSWETVKHGEQSYLYLKMDSNFYEFLLEVDNVKLAAISGSIDELSNFSNLKQLHSGSPNIQKYVVIPCDDFQEIISTSTENRKQLAEVLDVLALGE